MNTDYEDAADRSTAECYRLHHAAPEPECPICTGPRALVQRCAACDGVLEDGRWYTDMAGNVAPLDCPHDLTDRVDDWARAY